MPARTTAETPNFTAWEQQVDRSERAYSLVRRFEAKPSRRRRHAPCRAVEQPYAEPGFELANGLAQKDGWHIVTSRLSGNFPGSPVDLRFVFQLECGKIAFLQITP
jgi:hypothetical protein